MLDVGANFGWYSLLSLSLGCRVDAFEPVSSYRDVIRLAVHLNPGFAARLRLFANVDACVVSVSSDSKCAWDFPR